MPERQWKQIVRDTALKRREELFGKIPDHIKNSPIWESWKQKYTPQEILFLVRQQELPWEKRMEEIAFGDPLNLGVLEKR